MLGRKSRPKSGEDEAKRGFDDFELRLGDVMRGERATLGKSLLDVQRELKIKATYIAAVENADPSVFETPGFIAGYVRSYARYLGLDPEWAFERFCEESGFAGMDGMTKSHGGGLASKAKTKSVGRVGLLGDDKIVKPVSPYVVSSEGFFDVFDVRAIGSIAVVLVLIGGLGFGGYSVLREVQRVQFAPVDQAPGVVADIDTLAAQPGLPGGTTTGEEIAGFTAPSTDALDRLYRPQALEAPVLTARDGPIASLDPSSIGALVAPRDERSVTTAAGSAIGPQDAPVTPVKVVEDQAPDVVLFAVRPSWVRVANQDGTVLFEKILDAGERYIVPVSDEPPVLRAGNSGSLFFSVLGETLGPAGPGTSVAKNVPLGVQEIVASYQPADTETDPALTQEMMTAAAAPLAEDAPEEAIVSE